MVMLMLRRVNSSLAAVKRAMAWRQADLARSRPLGLGTRAERVASGGLCRSRARRSSASASWGTHFGWTKLVASMRTRPAAARSRTKASLASVGMGVGSFWRPSRGPTSTICTIVFWGLGGGTGVDFDEELGFGDLVSGGDVDGFDGAVDVGVDGELHLHGFEDHEFLTF